MTITYEVSTLFMRDVYKENKEEFRFFLCQQYLLMFTMGQNDKELDIRTNDKDVGDRLYLFIDFEDKSFMLK